MQQRMCETIKGLVNGIIGTTGLTLTKLDFDYDAEAVDIIIQVRRERDGKEWILTGDDADTNVLLSREGMKDAIECRSAAEAISYLTR